MSELTEAVEAAADAQPDTGPEAVQEVTETPSESPAPSPSSDELTPAQQERARELVLQAIQRRDQQWQQRIQQQESQKPVQEPKQAPIADEEDDIDAQIAALYSDDDTGRATQKAISQHLRLMLKKMGAGSGLTEEQVRNIAAEAAGGVRNEIRSGLSVNEEVSDLVRSGVISGNESAIVQKEYQKVLRDPQMAQAAADPANAPWILKGVVYDLVKAGKLKPGAERKRPKNPMSPGGPGGAAPKATIDPKASPFKTVRSLSAEKLKEVRARHG